MTSSSTRRPPVLVAALASAVLATGCQSAASRLGPIRTADYVDLERFMGDWYVIANIPTFLEKDAYNAVETYELVGEDRVATTFSFRKGGFDGKEKVYTPTGFVRDDPSNAVWGMRFVWPIKAEYRVVYVDEDYAHTIIGRSKRDFVWIMSREPQIPDDEYDELVGLIQEEGYDVTRIRKVPQRW